MPAPEAVPELVRGVVLLVAHALVPELGRALSVVLAPLEVHDLGRGVNRGVGREVDRVSLGLPEVQMA